MLYELLAIILIVNRFYCMVNIRDNDSLLVVSSCATMAHTSIVSLSVPVPLLLDSWFSNNAFQTYSWNCRLWRSAMRFWGLSSDAFVTSVLAGESVPSLTSHPQIRDPYIVTSRYTAWPVSGSVILASLFLYVVCITPYSKLLHTQYTVRFQAACCPTKPDFSRYLILYKRDTANSFVTAEIKNPPLYSRSFLF